MYAKIFISFLCGILITWLFMRSDYEKGISKGITWDSTWRANFDTANWKIFDSSFYILPNGMKAHRRKPVALENNLEFSFDTSGVKTYYYAPIKYKTLTTLDSGLTVYDVKDSLIKEYDGKQWVTKH